MIENNIRNPLIWLPYGFEYAKMEIIFFRKDIENIFNHFLRVCLEFDLRKNCTNMHASEAGRLRQKPLMEKTKAL